MIDLVKRMQKGDELAFNEIYQEFYEPMLYIAYELTHNDADAKDATQDMFIQLHKSISTLHEPVVFVLWMKRILAHKCHNVYRARKRMVYHDDLTMIEADERIKHEDTTKKNFQEKSSREILLHLVKQLNYAQQEVVVLHYFDQLKFKEIATILEISEGTVKSRMNAAKQNLRILCNRYEKVNHERISMHSRALGLSLSSMYASRYVPLPWKKLKFQTQSALSSFSSVALPATLGSALVVGVVASPTIYQHLQKQETSSTQVIAQPVIQTGSNDFEAYFSLKNWAHCKDEMETKSLQDFQRMAVYYTKLEKEKGVYWDALCKESWAQDFEQVYSSKK